MDNKIIDMNEWVRWVLEQHPSQNQITTIKKFWKCHKLEDYEKVFKDFSTRFGFGSYLQPCILCKEQ